MAIAQQAGRRITFVAFSFGWVSHSFRALMSIFGDGTFMPPPDYPAVVITVGSYIKKANQSWVIGRLIRDLEREIREEHSKDQEALNSALVITFYEASEDASRGTPKVPAWDWWCTSFFLTLAVQFGLTLWPFYNGNWDIFCLTLIGTLLALVTGSLPEWRREKYKCRDKTKSSYVLTRGNGHQYAFVVQPGSSKHALHLEDLAGAIERAGFWTRCSSIALAVAWVVFLISAAGIADDAWFLFGVGAVGMVQNVIVAGVSRKSAVLGIPLRRLRTFGTTPGHGRRKVMEVLLELAKYKHAPGETIRNVEAAIALRREFLPDQALRDDEWETWMEIDKDLGRARPAQMDRSRIEQQPRLQGSSGISVLAY